MVRAISEDWLAVICANGNPPEWAVTDACRWWIGPDNPHRGKKPQAGDIAKRIKWELGPVAMGEVKVAGYRPQADEQRERRSEAEIKRMAEAGNRAVKALQRKAGAQ